MTVERSGGILAASLGAAPSRSPSRGDAAAREPDTGFRSALAAAEPPPAPREKTAPAPARAEARPPRIEASPDDTADAGTSTGPATADARGADAAAANAKPRVSRHGDASDAKDTSDASAEATATGATPSAASAPLAPPVATAEAPMAAGTDTPPAADQALLLAQSGLMPSAPAPGLPPPAGRIAPDGGAARLVTGGAVSAIGDAASGGTSGPGPTASSLEVADASTATPPSPPTTGVWQATAVTNTAARGRAGITSTVGATDATNARAGVPDAAVIAASVSATAAPPAADRAFATPPHTAATLLQQRAAAQDAASGAAPASAATATAATTGTASTTTATATLDAAFAANFMPPEAQALVRRRERAGSSEAGGADAVGALFGGHGGTAPASASMLPVNAAGAGAATTASGTTASLVDQFGWWMAQKTQGAELTVDVGGQPVSVSVKVQGNEAQVVFRSDAPEARQALAQALPQLRDMLGGEGMVLADASVGGWAAGSGGGATGGGQGGDGRPVPAGTRDGDALRAPAAAGPATAAPPRGTAGRRSLDLYV